jgi:hypothetical protein
VSPSLISKKNPSKNRNRKSAFVNTNSEVAGGGGLDEARPECARPRAQQHPQPRVRWIIHQPLSRRALLQPGTAALRFGCGSTALRPPRLPLACQRSCG